MKAKAMLLMYGAFLLIAGTTFFTLPYQVIALYGDSGQPLTEMEMILTRSD